MNKKYLFKKTVIDKLLKKAKCTPEEFLNWLDWAVLESGTDFPCLQKRIGANEITIYSKGIVFLPKGIIKSYSDLSIFLTFRRLQSDHNLYFNIRHNYKEAYGLI